MTTLPLPPGTLAVLLLLGLGAVVFLALALTRPRRPDRPAAIPPEARPALMLLAGLTWAVLFLMTLAAAFSGVAGAVAEPGAAGLGLGGLLVALLGAPFLIWTTWLKHRTVEFQKEGHMTDRISKAVEQLGAEKKVDRIGRPVTLAKGDPNQLDPNESIETKTLIEWQGQPVSIDEGWWVQSTAEWRVFSESVPNLEVRIGAILSLERIAQDSTRHDKGRDHVRVMEILCAYVRNNFQAKSLVPTAPPFSKKMPRTDLQTCIDVLKRRNDDQRKIESRAKYRLDLRSCDFDGCDFSEGNFEAADFNGSRFELCRFNGALLDGASLIGALLVRPDFNRSSLRGTDFSKGRIIGRGLYDLDFTRDCVIFFEGASAEGIGFTKEIAGRIFGSRDTQVDHRYQRARQAGSLLAERTLDKIQGIDSERKFWNDQLAGYTAEELAAGEMFSHWSPFDIYDLVTPEFRNRFIATHGLTCWPHRW